MMRYVIFLASFTCSLLLHAQNDTAAISPPDDDDAATQPLNGFVSQLGFFGDYGTVINFSSYNFDCDALSQIHQFRNMRAKSFTTFEPYFIVPVSKISDRHLLGAAVLFRKENWDGDHNIITVNQGPGGIVFNPEGRFISITPLYYYRAMRRKRSEWLVGIAVPVGVTSGIRLQQQFSRQLGNWMSIHVRTTAEFFKEFPELGYSKITEYSKYHGLLLSGGIGLAFSHPENAPLKKDDPQIDSLRKERKSRTEFITWIGGGLGVYSNLYHRTIDIYTGETATFETFSVTSYGPEWRRRMRRNERFLLSIRLTMNLVSQKSETVHAIGINGSVNHFYETYNLLQLSAGSGYTFINGKIFKADVSLMAHEYFDFNVQRIFTGASVATGLRLASARGWGIVVSPQMEFNPFNKPFTVNNATVYDGRHRFRVNRIFGGIVFPLKPKPKATIPQ